MFDLLLQELMGRYGHLSVEEMKARMREDGLGDLSDIADELTHELMTRDPELLEHLLRHSPFGPVGEDLTAVMPPTPEVEALPVDLDDDIFFDHDACLTSCTGRCCQRKNYLMIAIPDIYRIVSSPAARLLDIRSTADLFGRQPPVVQSIFNSEYGLYLPYIRYRPVGAAPDLPPEEAPDSVCPFLFPIDEVISFHRGRVSHKVSRQARGCILMRDKPKVCRLSPLGVFSGLTTGTSSYVYAPPALDCPACDTRVVVKVAEYLRGIELPGERAQEKRLHRVVMATSKRRLAGAEQQRYGEILQQLYNIDELLLREGVDLQHRPGVERLVRIATRAAQGAFAPYDELVQELVQLGGRRQVLSTPSRYRPGEASKMGPSLRVRVSDDLVLDAGTCEELVGPDGPCRLLRPPATTMSHQVLAYLRAKPDPPRPPSGTATGREGVAAAAICLRWGSYLAVLADHDKPVWDMGEEASRISDQEMARINIEASAALAEWIDLFRQDPSGKGYYQLVDRAVAYLPMPQKTAKAERHPLAGLSNPEMAGLFVKAVGNEGVARVRAEVDRHPSRVFANALVNVAWRSGPVEDIHAGEHRGCPLDRRRIRPAEERHLMRFAASRLALGMDVALVLAMEQPPRPWPDQVLPYALAGLMLVTPSGWTLTETSREVTLPG